MLKAILWILVVALFAMWSGAIWAVHALAVWSLNGLGAMGGQSPPIDGAAIPAWVALWIPAEFVEAFQATAAAVLPWVESSLAFLPALADWLAPLAWFVWGVGVLVLALGAVALQVLISVARRRAAP